MVRTLTFATVLGLAVATGSAQAAGGPTATAVLKTQDGSSAGTVTLSPLPEGSLVEADLTGLPAGSHAFHVHETGDCSGDFKAAGGHYAPDGNDHGLRRAGGPHAGDFPNIHVPEDGTLTVDYVNDRLALDEHLFDDDGAAIVIHAGADDYKSQPAGDAGSRIACGVIEPQDG